MEEYLNNGGFDWCRIPNLLVSNDGLKMDYKYFTFEYWESLWKPRN